MLLLSKPTKPTPKCARVRAWFFEVTVRQSSLKRWTPNLYKKRILCLLKKEAAGVCAHHRRLFRTTAT